MSSTGWRVLLLLLGALPRILAAADASAAAAERPVALPPFIVEEASKGPPWRYAESDGYEILSRRLIVRPRESIEWCRRLTEVGVFAGISSGAILAGAVKAASLIDEGTIVMIVCDGGWKYLSAGVWTDDLDTVEERAKATIYF